MDILRIFFKKLAATQRIVWEYAHHSRKKDKSNWMMKNILLFQERNSLACLLRSYFVTDQANKNIYRHSGDSGYHIVYPSNKG